MAKPRTVCTTAAKHRKRPGRRVRYPTPRGIVVEFVGESYERWTFRAGPRMAFLLNCHPPVVHVGGRESLPCDPSLLVCPGCSIRIGFDPRVMMGAYSMRGHSHGTGLCDECRIEEAQERGARLQAELGINLGCSAGEHDDPRRIRSKFMPRHVTPGHRRIITLSQKLTGYSARPDMRHNGRAMVENK
jgi:hypothetical protein